ncbi:MAG: clostripain-related cysteine peptidase [Chloroflexota bacterium]
MAYLLRLMLLGLAVTLLTPISGGHAAEDVIEDAAHLLLNEGRIDDETPFHEIPFTVIGEDQTLILDLAIVSGDLDTLLYLVTPEGIVLDRNDDRARGDRSSLIVYPAVPPGDYVAVATRYKVTEGDTSGEYRLGVAVAPGPQPPTPPDLSAQGLAAAGFPELAPRPLAEWTVLVYYGADTNLEGAIIEDLHEFELGGGSDEDVRIVAMMDRHPEFATNSGNWVATRLFELEAASSHDSDEIVLASTEMADFGQRNSADGALLAQFLAWGVQQYPAQRYAVAFASHGAGWSGVITDDTADHAIISLPELRRAFEAATSAAGVDHFDVLINDACLMSSVEYHAVVSDMFGTSYASPELVVNPALNMTLFTEAIRAAADADLNTVGQSLVNRYISQDGAALAGSLSEYITSAVIDLQAVDPLVTAVENFAALVNTDPGRYVYALGAARSNVHEYGSAAPESPHLIDLGDLMTGVIRNARDEALIRAAQRVLDTLRESVAYAEGGPRVNNRVSYQNIYFPARSRDFDTRYFAESPLTEWGRMLRNYFSVLTPRSWLAEGLNFHAPTAPQVTITNRYPPEGEAASIHNIAQLNWEIVGRLISEGRFTADWRQPDGTYRRLSSASIVTPVLDADGLTTYVNTWQPGVEDSGFEWNVRVDTISDGQQSRYALLRGQDEQQYLAGRFRQPGSDQWSDVSVTFEPADGINGVDARAGRVIAYEEENNSAAVVDIPPGAEFQVYDIVVEENGRTSRVPDETVTFTWPEGGLTANYEVPAPSGVYRLGFELIAFGGETGTAAIDFTVDNDGLDPDLRAYVDLDWGFNLRYPNAWSEFTPTAFGYWETYSGEAEAIRYYPLTPDVAEFDLDTLLFQFIDTFNIDAYEGTPQAIDGKPALVFDFEEPGVLVGRALLVLDPDLLIGHVFAAVDYENATPPTDHFDTMLEGLSFFDARTWQATDSGRWSVETIGYFDEGSLPAPQGWTDYSFDDGLWLGYAPDETRQDSPTFARIAQFTASDADTLRDRLLADVVQADATDFELVDTRTYAAENYGWSVARYSLTRDDTPITGRLYTTIAANGVAYAAWFEVPTGQAEAVVVPVFEPMLDGFNIPDPYRSYVNPDFGFSIRTPVAWYPVFQDAENFQFITSDVATRETLYIFYQDEPPADAAAGAARLLDSYGFIQTGEPVAMLLNEWEGLAVNYEDPTLGTQGSAFVLEPLVNGRRFILAYETTDEGMDTLSILLELGSRFRLLDDADAATAFDLLPADETAYQPYTTIFEEPVYGYGFELLATWDFVPESDDPAIMDINFYSSTQNTLLVLTYEATTSIDAAVESYDIEVLSREDFTLADLPAARMRIDPAAYGDATITNSEVLAVELPDGPVLMLFAWATPGGDIPDTLDRIVETFYTFEAGTIPNMVTSDEDEAAEVTVTEGDTQPVTLDDLGGFGLALPSGWSDMTYDADYDWYNSFDPTGSTGIYIYYVDAADSQPEAIASLLIEEIYSATIISDFETLTVDGLDAVAFDLTWEATMGRALAVNYNGLGLVISVESFTNADVSALFEAVQQSLTFP